MFGYNVWTKHGEEGVMMEDGDEEDNDDNYRSIFPEYGDTAMEDNEEEGGEERAPDEPGDDDLRRAIYDARRDCGTDKERLQFDKITYEAKKLVYPLGLDVQKIHACPNDCILYRGKYENENKCPICGALRYKIRRDDPDDVKGEPPRKRVPAKVMWYAPIIPRLKRLFRNKEHAKLLRWHMEERKKDAMLMHPADDRQWRNIEREFPDFAVLPCIRCCPPACRLLPQLLLQLLTPYAYPHYPARRLCLSNASMVAASAASHSTISAMRVHLRAAAGAL
ncbi:hypothetical protein QYE76_059746 [Lolium multiflorum]|uniref:Uncharacterized protein n=1 Tax=Lolium multiflorum TaxID=4521 RepID=A0AAD8W363_LOLMU|nr:hypothetical protein QYE76_059746 [Lolium multiflorum]